MSSYGVFVAKTRCPYCTRTHLTKTAFLKCRARSEKRRKKDKSYITAIVAGDETASWVIREKATGRVILETFSAEVVAKLNTARYEAVPILQHLQEFNRTVKS